MTFSWRFRRRCIAIVALVALMTTGCASIFVDIDDRMHRKRFKSDYEMLEQANTAYDEGDYNDALERFMALRTTSTSPKIVRKTRLGEICSRLMLARTQTEYTAAIGLWHAYAKTVATSESDWDPRLFDPLIVRMTPAAPPIQKEVSPAVEPAPVPLLLKVPTVPVELPPDARQCKAELAVLRKKADQAEQLQRRLDEIQSENQSLKEKIKALEAIDQNIQKKKTEIAAPAE